MATRSTDAVQNEAGRNEAGQDWAEPGMLTSVLGDRHVYDQGIVAQWVDRDDARDTVDIPGRTIGAAAFRDQPIPWRFGRHLLPHHIFGVGVAGDDGAVPA